MMTKKCKREKEDKRDLFKGKEEKEKEMRKREQYGYWKERKKEG